MVNHRITSHQGSVTPLITCVFPDSVSVTAEERKKKKCLPVSAPLKCVLLAAAQAVKTGTLVRKSQ